MSTATATRRARTTAVEAFRIAVYARISDDKKRIKAGIAGRNVGEQVDDALTYAARVLGVDPGLAVDAGILVGMGKAAPWVPNPDAENALIVVYRKNDRSACKRQTVTATINGVTQETERVVRPVWNEMMAELRTGTVGSVVALDMDRMLRDPLDLEDAIITATRYVVA